MASDKDALLADVERQLREAFSYDEQDQMVVDEDAVQGVLDLFDRARMAGVINKLEPV